MRVLEVVGLFLLTTTKWEVLITLSKRLWQGAKTLLSNGNGFKRFCYLHRTMERRSGKSILLYRRPVDGTLILFDDGEVFLSRLVS